MFGVTQDGFNRKTYDNIWNDMVTRARNVFGENVDTSVTSPLGMFLRVVAFSLSLAWQLAEKVYNSAFVDFATGINLDHVGKYIGIQRREAVKATGEATFSGDDGTDIPEGFVIETDTEEPVQFETTEAGTISGGSAILEIQALEAGTAGNVEADTITVIVNPLSGLSSVTNANATGDEDSGYTQGAERETDAEFRQRYRDSVAKGGASTIESIRASLLEIDNVNSAVVEENDTDATVDGIPAKSIRALVYGGVDDDIAQSIFETKSGGIRAYGTTEITVTDSMDNDHTIGFTRPTEVDIYVDVALTTNSDFPADGDEQVETEIVKYIGGTDADSNEYTGLGLGEDVIYIKVISAITQVDGVLDADVTIGTSDNPTGTDNISIDNTEVAITDSTKVDVS